QKAFAADPVFAGLAASHTEQTPDAIVAYHHDTTAVMDSAVRMAQAFPDSPTVQLKLCDGLEGVLAVVRERLTVQERALAQRRTNVSRIDRLAAVYSAMCQMRPADLKPVAALSEELLDDARQTRPLRFLTADVLSASGELLAPSRFLAAHAVNVAQVVARVVHLDYEWAGRPLLPVLAALLMDCGMMRVPPAVLAKAGPLTPDERRLVESHPHYGAEWVLRYVQDAAPLADAIAAHHERADGTGYPVGLKGSTVPALGRLLAVADAYVGMCEDRPHRPGQDTRASLTDILLLAEQGQLDRDFAEYLVQLSFYPVGSVVELTDGRVGVVAANHHDRLDPRAPGRPVVAVLAEADGTVLPRPEHLDLSVSGRGGVVRTLSTERRRTLLGSRYPDLV
ncbi:MAG: HD domain-containing protein, partial [Gemmataceae bacterium]|nr:HD domain-containing protein [Gemmataceae bacterium]